MKSKWTNISRGLFYFSFVLGFIVVLAGAIIFWFAAGTAASNSRSDNGLSGTFGFLGFLTLIVGSVINVAIHSLWGMLIEMSDNIINGGAAPAGQADSAAAGQVSPTFAGQRNPTSASRENKTWVCHRCNCQNPQNTMFCQSCGENR